MKFESITLVVGVGAVAKVSTRKNDYFYSRKLFLALSGKFLTTKVKTTTLPFAIFAIAASASPGGVWDSNI